MGTGGQVARAGRFCVLIWPDGCFVRVLMQETIAMAMPTTRINEPFLPTPPSGLYRFSSAARELFAAEPWARSILGLKIGPASRLDEVREPASVDWFLPCGDQVWV